MGNGERIMGPRRLGSTDFLVSGYTVEGLIMTCDNPSRNHMTRSIDALNGVNL